MHDYSRLALAALLAAALAGCTDDAPPSEPAAPDAAEAPAEPVVADPTGPIPAPDDVSAVPAGATVTDSGLAYRHLQEGPADGRRPTTADRVTVHYTGWRAEDGEMFDSSVVRGEPATFGVTQVIAGWIEALQLMRPGDKIRVWIPGELAYDNSTRPGAPKGMLVFDIELLEIVATD